MSKEDNRSHSQLRSHLCFLREAESGHLDELTCPFCHSPSVSVWFSNPAPGVFRMWFVCTACSFQTRTQHAKKPNGFSPARVRDDLQKKDEAVLKQSKFKNDHQ